MKNNLSFGVIIALCSVYQLSGQTFEYKTHIHQNDTLLYRMLYPADFNPDRSYPMLLFLHGAGERGNDNEKQLTHGSKQFLTDSFRAEYPALIVFPQCPTEDYWANVDIDRSNYPIKLDFKENDSPTRAMAQVLSLLDSLVNLPFTKDDQIYLGGLSMGGMGTYELLSRRPSTFAAAFAICGGGYAGNASKYAQTAVWVFHGSNDNVVAPYHSTLMVGALQQAGAEVRYNLYPHANHNSWDRAFAEPELFQWLFDHKK